MIPPSPRLPVRARALAELVRARGWVGDADLEAAVGEALAGGGKTLEAVLLARGLLDEGRLRALAEVLDGPTIPAGLGATVAAPGRVPASLDATLAPGRVLPAGEGPRGGGGATLGPYRLLREIGRGGMGVVHRALDTSLGREVAVKVLPAADIAGADAESRFRREAELLARVGRHPHLVAIHGAGRDGERLWFAMDLVDGRSLHEQLRAEGPMLPGRAAQLAADLAGALEFAHRAGVLHRDVKPHNVLLDRHGRGFLTDFGLAKDVAGAAGLTLSGAALGTPAYMSPEVAAFGAGRASAASDVYSLGATLYEMLAGRPPFVADSGEALLRSVVHDDPPPLLGAVPRDLAVVCLKAMRKEPVRRYAAAADLEADLRRWLAREPILARPAGFVERLAARSRRHPGLLVAVAAACLLAAAAGAGWAWKAARGAAAARSAATARAFAADRLRAARQHLERAEQAGDLGHFRRRDEALAAAAAALDDALAADPALAEALFLRGRALDLAGRAAEALQAFEDALRLNPAFAVARFEHGLILQRRLARLRAEDRSRALDRLATGRVFAMLRLPAASGEAGTSRDQAALLAAAAADFAAPGSSQLDARRQALGAALLDHLEGRQEAALNRLRGVLEADPYDVEALRAAADVAEAALGPSEALEFRERLHRVRPGSALVSLELAAAIGFAADQLAEGSEARRQRTAQGLALVAETLAGVEPDFDILMLAVNALATLRGFAEAELPARQALAIADTRVRRRTALVALVAVISPGRPVEALTELDRLGGFLEEAERRAVRLGLLLRARREADALAEWRALPPDSSLRQGRREEGYLAELACGNLLAAEILAEEDAARSLWGALERRGIVRLRLGKLPLALEDLRALGATEPSSYERIFATAEAWWLSGEYRRAFAHLGAALAELEPVGGGNAAKNIEAISRSLGENAGAEEAAKALDRLTALLILVVGSGPGRETLEGNWSALATLMALDQEWSWRRGWTGRALDVGASLRALHATGLAHFRDARARAAAGMQKTAIKALEEAVKLGFDEGALLDAEPAFEGLRGEEAYRAIRARCR